MEEAKFQFFIILRVSKQEKGNKEDKDSFHHTEMHILEEILLSKQKMNYCSNIMCLNESNKH